MIFKSLEFKALFLLVGIVAVLAVPTTISIITEAKPEIPLKPQTQTTNSNNQHRSIASIKPHSIPAIKSDGQFAMVANYQCKDTRELVVSSETVRFKGISDECMNKDWKDVTLVNLTNGFTGEVLFHQNGYTTDYIDLQEGSNQLVLKATAPDGSLIERKIEILKRRIASTPEEP